MNYGYLIRAMHVFLSKWMQLFRFNFCFLKLQQKFLNLIDCSRFKMQDWLSRPVSVFGFRFSVFEIRRFFREKGWLETDWSNVSLNWLDLLNLVNFLKSTFKIEIKRMGLLSEFFFVFNLLKVLFVQRLKPFFPDKKNLSNLHQLFLSCNLSLTVLLKMKNVSHNHLSFFFVKK